MPAPRWKIAAVPLAVAALASPFGCHHADEADPRSPTAVGPGGLAPTCDELKTGDFSTLIIGGAPPPPNLLDRFGRPPPPPLPPGTGDDIKFLMAKTHALPKIAPKLEQELIDACTELGRAAGVPDGDLAASPDLGHGAERACNAAASKVSAMFRRAKESRIVLDLHVEPSRCFVNVTAAQRCLSSCGAPPRGDIRAHCVGGEVMGACSGRCSGACALPPGAGDGICHGTCSGKCDREFRGACGGRCSGTCDGVPTRGARRCDGVCDGSCSKEGEGTCLGRCDGSCSGLWEPPYSGKCAGVCRGVCNGAEVTDPLCTGEYAPPGTDPVCLAACNAVAALDADCEPPVVRVTARGPRIPADLQRLLAGIQSAVPKIVRIQQGRGKRLPRAIEAAVSASVDWSNTFATAGQRPLFCVRSNIDALKDAENWINLALRGTEAIAPAIKTEPLLQGKPEDE